MLNIPCVRRLTVTLASLLCAALASCSGGGTAPLSTSTTTSVTPSQWVVAWAASPESAMYNSSTNPGGSEQTFRFFLYPTIGGTQERVRFSNLYGLTPVTVGGARLAAATTAGPAVDSTRDRALTFSGSASVIIPAGQEVLTDPVNITYNYGEQLAVTAYLQGTFGPLVQHNTQFITNYQTPSNAGNQTTDAAGTSLTNTNLEWYMVTEVDVYGPYQGTVAYFGSSSVDGHGANYGNTNFYPTYNVPVPGQNYDRPSDWLARQLQAAGYNLGVANAGILGDPAAADATTASDQTLSGIQRMQHDVLQLPNIKAVVIYLGGVDLRIDCTSAANVEASLTNMVAQANAVNVRVILATIPPAEYCTTSPENLLPSAGNPWQGDINPGPENPGSTQRRAVNDWIRSSGAQLPGVVAIADFDAALAYPAHPDFLLPNLTSSDPYHPNGAGYQVQSGAIPLKAILGF